MAKKQNKPPEFMLTGQRIIKGRPRMVAVESQKFFKECFVKGGFTDTSFVPWRRRSNPLAGKKILIGYGNTMNLMQSIRTLEATENRVRTGTTLSYAPTHNNGDKIKVTLKMKKFWWARYYEFAGKTNRGRKGKRSGGKRVMALNAKAEFCRNMALMKVGQQITIPKNQFIGESRTLLNEFAAWFKNEIEKTK